MGMKVYKFYRVSPEKKEIPVVYAYTDKKEYAQRFESERDMNKFRKVTTKVSLSEFQQFEQRYRPYQLELNGYYTKEDNALGKKKVVFILSTMLEQERACILNERIMESITKDLFDAKPFKDKYLKALYILNFIELYVFYKLGIHESYDYFYSGMDLLYCNEFGEYNRFGSVTFDELGIFLTYFGNTFKTRGERNE